MHRVSTNARPINDPDFSVLRFLVLLHGAFVNESPIIAAHEEQGYFNSW